MNFTNDISTPVELDLLVAFFDQTGFAKRTNKFSSAEIFYSLSEYYEFVGTVVESAGGTVVKFIGDAGLIIFPEDKIDEGVFALSRLKIEGDQWLAKRGIASKNIVQMHFGPVMCGPLGTTTEKRFDVIGLTVNTAATVKSNGFAMTAQVFRKLSPNLRRIFKKHTPPITYIPIEERH